jgi:hypothetical protein
MRFFDTARSRALIVLFCVVGVLGVWHLGLHAYKEQRKGDPLTESQKKFLGLVRSEGPAEAYKQYKVEVLKNAEASQLHAAEHAWGRILFYAKGADALRDCSETYAGGCGHEVIAETLFQTGMAGLQGLFESCSKLSPREFLNCQHGLGHGILAELGYATSSVPVAMEYCDRLHGSTSVEACAAGVMMEFNFRSMLGPEEEHFRAGTIETRQTPCDLLQGASLKACVYWAPAWWSGVLLGMHPGATVAELFRDMGAWCESTAPFSVYPEFCYRGIGNIAPADAHFDPALTHTACASASRIASKRMSCFAVAGARIADRTLSLDKGLSICDAEDDAGRLECRRRIRLELRSLPEMMRGAE